MFPPTTSEEPIFYRVDIPNHPDALVTSRFGSIVSKKPEGVSYRTVEWADIDRDSIGGVVLTNQTFDALGINDWHTNGYLGQDVKIAVFDVEWMGAEWDNPDLGATFSHDCFAHASCELPINSSHPRFGFERGVHGIACAEIIRDIAPKAELHLVRVLGQTSLENAVDWAIREDIDFISMSLSFFNESFYDGSGPISGLMDSLAAHDIQMVTSSGNYALAHFRSEFQDVNGDGNHDFSDARGLPIYFEPGKRSINLIWNEFQNCGLGDLNAYLWSRDGTLIAKSLTSQVLGSNDCHPSEKIVAMIEEEDWTFLTIENVGETAPAFDVMAKGGYVFQPSKDGSIVDPGTHPSVLTVGAVRVGNYIHNEVESFSSYGPTNSRLVKPEVVGPNGLSTNSYGPSNFYGTSASTPAVTGALAVYKSKHITLENSTITDRIIELAIQDTPTILVSDSQGFGKVRLPKVQNQEIQCGGSVTAILIVIGVCLRQTLFQRTTKS